MDKKQLAYILIGIGVIAAGYFIYRQVRNKQTAGALGAGMPDTRGAWAADDDALYTQMRDLFSSTSGDAPALGSWVDEAVRKEYEQGLNKVHLIAGSNKTKAGAFLAVFEKGNPNTTGKYLGGDGKPQLWPESLHVELWNMFNNLKIKYGAL